MISGFEINFVNILRLFTLIRYERARRKGQYRRAAQCFTRDVLYWEIEQDGSNDRVRVRGREALEKSFYQSDFEFVMESVVPIDSEWDGDQVSSHWRAMMRVTNACPGNVQRALTGFTRIRFVGWRMSEMVTVFTSVRELAETNT